jgi:hypothetical protein
LTKLLELIVNIFKNFFIYNLKAKKKELKEKEMKLQEEK